MDAEAHGALAIGRRRIGRQQPLKWIRRKRSGGRIDRRQPPDNLVRVRIRRSAHTYDELLVRPQIDVRREARAIGPGVDLYGAELHRSKLDGICVEDGWIEHVFDDYLLSGRGGGLEVLERDCVREGIGRGHVTLWTGAGGSVFVVRVEA